MGGNSGSDRTTSQRMGSAAGRNPGNAASITGHGARPGISISGSGISLTDITIRGSLTITLTGSGISITGKGTGTGMRLPKDTCVGSIRGYRLARVWNGRLMSLYHDFSLTPLPMQAWCTERSGIFSDKRCGNYRPGAEQLAPVVGCECGFYMTKGRPWGGNAFSLSCQRPGVHVVCGVSGWGRVIEHDAGFRCQWQQIDWVLIPPFACNTAGLRGARYNLRYGGFRVVDSVPDDWTPSYPDAGLFIRS